MAICASCHGSFTCGMRDAREPCWCASLPPLAEPDPAHDCLCPACLAGRLAAKADRNEAPISPSSHDSH